MTIDEAIAHAREVAAIQRNNDKLNKTLGVISPYYKTDCIKCAEEHEQLKEWLEELKDCRDKNKMVVRVDVENMDSIKDKIDELSKYAESQYNKAIDDFVDKLKTKCDGMIKDKWNSNVAPISWAEAYADFKDDIDGIAEQLKAGDDDA